MGRVTRRAFLQRGSGCLAAAAILSSGGRALASPFGLPIGLQLYSVREELAKDYAGTLKRVADAGYQEVEAAGFYHHSAAEVRQAMQTAGLRCVSAHYSYNDLNRDLDGTIAFGKDLGVSNLICSYPGFKDPARSAATAGPNHRPAFTLEDFRWNAEQFNLIGKKVQAAGMQFGYHNHTVEFHREDGVIALDEMMRLTDPALVTFEMDCGWVLVGGGDPADYLRRFPKRISMLHVKDFKPGAVTAGESPAAAELGHGTLDYKPIFAAAKKANIRHYFVEQEGYDMPMFDALKMDADYMKALQA